MFELKDQNTIKKSFLNQEKLTLLFKIIDKLFVHQTTSKAE